MAGFLDQKERIMDTIITQEGRSQLARFGKLSPVYYSFSDAGTVYDTDTIVSGSTFSGLEIDETYRPMFESVSLPQDTITFEKNDSGFINRIINETFEHEFNWRVHLTNGEFNATADAAGITVPLTYLFSLIYGPNEYKEKFEAFVDATFGSSFRSFSRQQILKTTDLLRQNQLVFSISPGELTFDFSDAAPIENVNNQVADIAHIEPLFWDKRLSHLPNFKFLPPVERSAIGASNLVEEDQYQDLSQNSILSFEDIKKDLDLLERVGSMKEVVFTDSSIENNLFSQVFEFSNNISSKLDIVDFGLFKDNGIIKHVYFAGKLYQNGSGQSTFVNLFTLVFEVSDI